MAILPQVQRLLQSSDGIIAVAIFPWGEGLPSEFAYTFSATENTTHDWDRVFQDILQMFKSVNLLQEEKTLQVTLDKHALVVEQRDEWLVLVAVSLGHSIRKSLRRMFNQTFRRLRKLSSATVVPFPRV